MVEIYLDYGRVYIPDTIFVPIIPHEINKYVQSALTRIIHPHIASQDHVFDKLTEGERDNRSNELRDREVRAVFLCLFMVLIGDYQHYITVIRFFPVPQFYFNKVCKDVCVRVCVHVIELSLGVLFVIVCCVLLFPRMHF